MSRLYIFTGKGGVGKSSVAAAHAIKSAKDGYRTLLVSTDMAHNLGDIFETALGKEPFEVAENLDAYEIDPNYVMENDFPGIQESLGKLLPQTGGSNMEDFGMLPGMEELFSLLKITDIYKEDSYERIIVDCAPTGETLSLLKFPELLSWYMEKFFPVGKVAVRLLAPVSKQFFKIELPNKKAMNDIEQMYLKLAELQELFKNRETTSIRLVTIPEKMVVEETKRNYMYMNLYNFNVDGLYINRILPREIENEFFDDWLLIQKKYMAQLEDNFGMLPIYRIPWYDEELKGSHAVERICKDVLSGDEVFDTKVITDRETFERNEKGYVLSVSLPYAKKEEVDLYQSYTDVVIKVDNFKRNIPLPNALRTYTITLAKLEEGILHIQFEKEEEENE
ncbi:ArsA family ATPase [Anaerocolumna xylanovorans]|uniref:arsenite-transporting ATPase n=1 Tax=Anaerocolumna xylanovorans DSM 12503 TaxID=1121345 RepID=A0A1M7XW55_9FIRM|nr:ArsA family ATPase [Anaerocolumna xylanovorans]SHO42949.1 arsenite-transporting ATPase [Anaerocolumna xylanovorans DSM 12503]